MSHRDSRLQSGRCRTCMGDAAMRGNPGNVTLTATDLVGHLDCRHLTNLNMLVAFGKLSAPKRWDPTLDILRERGEQHEKAYIDHLTTRGLWITSIPGVEITEDAVSQTIEAMKSGTDVI